MWEHTTWIHLTIAPLRWCTVPYSNTIAVFQFLIGCGPTQFGKQISPFFETRSVLGIVSKFHEFSELNWYELHELPCVDLHTASGTSSDKLIQTRRLWASRASCNAIAMLFKLMHYSCITHAFNRTLSKVVCNFWQVLPCLRQLFSSSLRTFLVFRNFGWIHLLQQSYSKACVNMTWYIDDWKMLAGWFSPTWCAKNCSKRLSTCLAFRFTRQLDIW